MQVAPEMIQRAVSFDWEALLPVAFFLLYGISQLLGRKKKDNKSAEEGNKAEVEAVERAREIREEIRRKVEERKQAASGRRPAPVSRPAYDPSLPDHRQRNLQPRQRTPREPAPNLLRPVVERRQQPTMQESNRTVEASQGPNLEELLKQQRKRLEESKRLQREARIKVSEIERKAARRQATGRTYRTSDYTRTGNFRDDLLEGLSHPNSTRQAILYREILGKPLGLR